MSKEKKNNPDGVNALASLLERISALEQALAIHENRLNSINIPQSTVNEIVIRTLRAHGQVLIQATTPPPEVAQAVEEAPQPEAEAAGG